MGWLMPLRHLPTVRVNSKGFQRDPKGPNMAQAPSTNAHKHNHARTIAHARRCAKGHYVSLHCAGSCYLMLNHKHSLHISTLPCGCFILLLKISEASPILSESLSKCKCNKKPTISKDIQTCPKIMKDFSQGFSMTHTISHQITQAAKILQNLEKAKNTLRHNLSRHSPKLLCALASSLNMRQ